MRNLSKIAAALILAVSPLISDDLNKEEGFTTIRESIGEVMPIEHARAQFRAGYISLDRSGGTSEKSSSSAVGGHIHISSKRWRGVKAAAELYTVQDMGLNSGDERKVEPTFFDNELSGFSTLSQAFINALWGETEIKIGRQMLDTPHADSDDIRMMPNYFMAYTLTDRSVERLTLAAGKIEQMAGWENGVDAKKFVNVALSYGAAKSSDGIYYASLLYEAGEESVVQAWYYKIRDIADLVYLEAATELYAQVAHTVAAIQFDRATGSGDKLIGNIDSSTWGVSLLTRFLDSGLSIYAAYNRENGETGAFGSLGGGPFFTSLEDQTLDAIGGKGRAWSATAIYDLTALGFEGLNASFSYGSFRADDSALYDTAETDITLSYDISERVDMTLACAIINDKTILNNDYIQIRLIAKYNFEAP
ncbi:MAG: OprD family porin [Hydrogenimonas sp.]|nr:OprD family porin [Hydrogenimonas sp.]